MESLTTVLTQNNLTKQITQAAGILISLVMQDGIDRRVTTGLVKTITFDNGKEFAEHQRIDSELKSTTYFADPFASWQRGSNENFNGLLRQYIPKKRPLSTVTEEEIKMIQDQLNNRPRKRLGFKTPNEVFMQSLKRVALRT